MNLVAGIVLLAVATVMVVKKPYWGIVLLIAILPIESALPRIPVVSSLNIPVGGLTVVVFLLRSMIRKTRWLFSPYFIIALVLFLFITFSYYTSPTYRADRNWAVTYLQLVILFWLTEQMLLHKHRVEILLLAFCVVTVCVGFVDIYDWVQRGFPRFLTFQTSAFLGSNQAARYYLLSTIILFFFMLRLESTRPRGIVLVLICTQVLAIFITGSKTSLLLLWVAFALILLYMVLNRKGRSFISVVTVIFFVSSSLFNLIPLYTDVIFPLIVNQTGTYGLRLQLQKAGINMFLDHPITGVGIGQFPANLDVYGYEAGYRRTNNLTAHNMYIQMLAEMGLIGISLFLMLIGAALWNLLKALRDPPTQSSDMNILTWLIFVMLVVILIGGWTKTDGANKVFWLLLALGCSIHRIVPVYKVKSRRRRRRQGV